MAILLIMVYVFIGAAIGATYYYLQLKADKYDKDVFNSVWVGLLWPVVAPFAFAFYFAKKMSERE